MAITADEFPQGISGEVEARAFWRMRKRRILAGVRQNLATGRLRLFLAVTLSALLWLGLFFLFAEGFRFLRMTISGGSMHDQMVRNVFGVFFFSLMIMLMFSTAIILYGSLFRSAEVDFLMTNPVRTERIFLHKFQEAVLLGSWGFLLMGSPMLVAYGVSADAPWPYFAILPPMMVAFVYLPSGVGAILCLGIVRCIPQRRISVLILSTAALALVAGWWAWGILTGPESDLLTPAWFRDMQRRLEFAEHRWLPSWWLSSGLLEAARGIWSEGVLFLSLMIANALFFRQLAIGAASKTYRTAFSAIHGRGSRAGRGKRLWMDRLLWHLTFFLSRPMRLLIVKDLRLFRRDPVQWLQFLIFFGLLGLYFFNIRQFRYSLNFTVWVNTISFLNLAVVGLLLSTFTTRFIFPMISMEGRHFWALGLLPVRRETILWSKFVFSATGSLIPCSSLILLSDFMLRVSPTVLATHQLTCVILCTGLSGIAVGLGARLPNMREDSPSRIAAGFGGTLNLVISTMYILAVVLLTAVPCHLSLVRSQTQGAIPRIVDWFGSDFWLQSWLGLGIVGSIALGVLATAIPMWMGFRAFRRVEF